MSGLQGLMEGRVVLVTGAGAGVGRGVSAAFGAAGAIVGIGVRRPEAAEETAADVAAATATRTARHGIYTPPFGACCNVSHAQHCCIPCSALRYPMLGIAASHAQP